MNPAGGILALTRSFFAVDASGENVSLLDTSISYRLSKDTQWSDDDVPVSASDVLVSPMPGDHTDTIAGTVGGLAPGQYFLLGLIDPDGLWTEYTKDNNAIVGPQINVTGRT